MTTVSADRVSVRCTKCNTVASLLVDNLSTWRADHDTRCNPRPMSAHDCDTDPRCGLRRPMSIAESERKRAEGGGTGKPPLGAAATPSQSAPSSGPLCGLVYNGDRCHLPLGHKEECTDANGNLLEIAF